MYKEIYISNLYKEERMNINYSPEERKLVKKCAQILTGHKTGKAVNKKYLN